MAAGVVVRFAGLTFNNGEDVDGDLLVVSDIVGWDGPDVDLVTVDRPLAAGAVVAYTRIGVWTLVVSGWVVAGPDGIGPARRKLAAAIYTLAAGSGTLEADEEDGTAGITVRLTGAVRTRQQGDTAISFEATLVATDPTKTLGGS